MAWQQWVLPGRAGPGLDAGQARSGLLPEHLRIAEGKTKVMANAFITPSGSDVTPAFQEYLRPLLGSDLPQPARLRGGAIAKLLKR
jgi:ATP-dependent phosphofructokinase / diphosphate-dependent phosphofructokinase